MAQMEIKLWTVEEIRHLLETSDSMVTKSLMKLYENQTDSERLAYSTISRNGRGFNSVDSQFLTDVAKQVLKGRVLSPKQIACVRKAIMKYAKQLTYIANEVN